jgi:hypothetical protein
MEKTFPWQDIARGNRRREWEMAILPADTGWEPVFAFAFLEGVEAPFPARSWPNEDRRGAPPAMNRAT